MNLQENKCKICGLELEIYDIDHIIPYSIVKCHELKNLQALCSNCHAKKSRKEYKKIQFVKNLNEKYCWKCNIVYSKYFNHICYV